MQILVVPSTALYELSYIVCLVNRSFQFSDMTMEDVCFKLTVEFVKSMSEWDVQEDDVVENVMTALLTSVNMHQVENNADGNCLFEACSFLIYGSARYHFQVRAEAVRFIQENERLFKDAVLSVQNGTYNAKNQIEDQDATANDTTDFMKYVERMSTIGEWGDALCIEALAMVHKLQLSLFVSPACYRVEFNADDASTKRHIALANLNNRHFRAVLPDSVCDSHYKPHFPVPSVALNSVNEASVSNLTIHEYCSLLGRKGNKFKYIIHY